jgi:hypothetical protein
MVPPAKVHFSHPFLPILLAGIFCVKSADGEGASPKQASETELRAGRVEIGW